MTRVSNWSKFLLLLWKNWTLQRNHKIRFCVELLLPAIFSLLLVLVRSLVATENKESVQFSPLELNTLEVYRDNIKSSRMIESFISRFIAKESEARETTFPALALYYSPKSKLLDELVAEVVETLNMSTYQGYETSQDLTQALIVDNALAGIQFDSDMADASELPNRFEFTLRFPSALRTAKFKIGMSWLTLRLFPQLLTTGPRNPDDPDGGVPGAYLREGFLPIQHALSMAYLRRKSNNAKLPKVLLQRYPYPKYIYDPLLQGLSSFISMIILLSFLYPCSNITRYVTTEKERQLKEVMKIMGLSNWLHWTAWFVKSFIMLSISAVLIALLIIIPWKDNVAVLTHCDFTVLVFFFLIYIVASISFCFMMATFFSKASTAAAVTAIVWFITYVPYMFTINVYDELSLATKLMWSILSNTAMGFGFKLILDFEGTGEGFHWNNLFTPVNIDDTLCIGYLLLMMLLSAAIYLLICLYVEQIFPGDFGVPRVWYFPFTRSFWCSLKRKRISLHAANEPLQKLDRYAFEADPDDRNIGLEMRNLKKRFGNKTAVKGLSINMYEDEITVLLGHNGAGKTTTISMLTGMIPPSSGTAIINGCDIRSNIEGARLSMGICPQHNVLFEDMSVSNHLRFFCKMKGLKGAAVREETDKYLRLIGLERKAHVMSAKLSGGMQRKLSVCCALCGNTKVVLCDEPSSGMDPLSRRQLWDLLQQEKTGRTVLLTTHFMDEADVLGDRIAIMGHGELKCYGTSFFLKKQYGSGYILVCVKRESCEPAQVTALLNVYIPDLQIFSDIGAELTYKLPDSYSAQFESMFSELERRAEQLQLEGYGVGITPLEEVFLKVGAEYATEEVQQRKKGKKRASSSADDEQQQQQLNQSDDFLKNQRLLMGMSLLLNQWRAMLLKKILYSWRSKFLFICQNFLPIFFVTITVLIARTRGTFREQPAMKISLRQYEKAVTVLERYSNITGDTRSVAMADQYAAVASSYGGAYRFVETDDQDFEQYILQLGKSIQVRINSRYLAAASIGDNAIIAWLNNQPLHTAPLTVNLVHNAMARALLGEDAHIGVTNWPLPYSADTMLTQLNTGNNLGTQLGTNLCFCMCLVSSFYIIFLIKERESRAKLLQFVGGVRVMTFWLSQFVWDFLTLTFTSLVVIITIVCFQEKGFTTSSELGRYFLILLLFNWAVLPLTYLAALCFKEPATGFSRLAIFNIFVGMAMFIVVIIMSFEAFDTSDIADIISWIFRVSPHFSLAMALNKAYTNIGKLNACDKVSALPQILICELMPKCCILRSFFDWKYPGILPETVYLIGVGILGFLLLIMHEYRLFSRLNYILHKRPIKPPPTLRANYFDSDVNAEREFILKMSPAELQEKNLVLDRVSKYYGHFHAVNQVSLCVRSAECFGLLGVNGAGKTTTFKMMTGDERISSGTAYVQGLNLKSDMNTVYKRIGYCPQFDALIDDLTGREVLRIFCLLRGVQSKRVKPLSEDLARSFGFMRHLDKPTKTYSGGNKRKLSTAIAILGSPSVVYLDEPTTGMDPGARRQLWSMVCRIRDAGKSIVLTSHSMEECEALCTRLAIMVNGEFKCIGSTQHLKNKFSKGLILKIKVRRRSLFYARSTSASLAQGASYVPEHKPALELVEYGENNKSTQTKQSYLTKLAKHRAQQRAQQQTEAARIASVLIYSQQQSIEDVKQFVKDKFPASVLQEQYQGMLTFYIPLTGIKWSKIFGFMERNRDELNVEDYAISQTTLEEIFLDFAKYQREDTRDTGGKRCCSCCCKC